MMSNADIFLAYAHEDKQIVDKFAEFFKNSGFKIFYDRENIEPGTDIYKFIDYHIKTAKCLIVFWSSNSVKSTEVQDEARCAKKLKILLPVFIEDIAIETLPYDFQVIHSINLSKWNGDYGDIRFGVLIEAVNIKTGRIKSRQKSKEPSEAAKLGLTLTNINLDRDKFFTLNNNETKDSKSSNRSQNREIVVNDSDDNRLTLLTPGDRIGHCRVIDLIAAGGMANVYKVWHEQLEVVRAIKILKPGYTDESKGRLEMEAKISANLRHPNIVDIYYMGYWNTIPYIEMEFIDGPSLKELLETRTRLSIPISISIAHYLCIALRFAYNQDMTLYGKVYDRLIHRDLKPANILLTSKGVVKLADFGIARPSEVSIHTVGSKIIGTFAYLSPEQLNGEKLDQRSDIYALGALLYEMLSGVRTFPQQLLADLVQKKSKGHYASFKSMGLIFPKPLIDIIEKCLQLDKNERYSDISDLDDALVTVFKRQSHKSYDEVLSSIPSEPTLPVVSITSPITMYRKMLISYIVGILILSFIVYLIIFGNLKSSNSNTIFPPGDNVKTTVENKINKGSTSLLKQHKQSHLQEVHQTLTPPDKASSKSPFDNGLFAFKAGNYAEAVVYLSKASLSNECISNVKIAKTFLLESYIHMKQFGRALQIAENDKIETAHFYLLKGELFFQLKKTVESMNAINKGLTFEQIDSSDLFRLRFLKAKVSEEIYNLKPNTDNMRRMSDDWNAYLNCLKWQ